MGKRENRRVIRVNLDIPLKVVMGSMGSEVRYELQTRDVSHNGFFLDFEKPGRFPFTAASIMEIWLELDAQHKIFFNGKMARVVYPTDAAAKVSGPGIAVRIVQIESEQQQRLVEFINRTHKDIEERKLVDPAFAQRLKMSGIDSRLADEADDPDDAEHATLPKAG